MKVNNAIREGKGITEGMHIERAHRSGKPVVVRLLFHKQKTLVLSNARNLIYSDGYDNIYVQEDFSEAAQLKRKGLLPTQR